MEPTFVRMAGGKGGGRGPMTREVQVSKKLSWLLRHAAEKEGLQLGEGGYINVQDVVCFHFHFRFRSPFLLFLFLFPFSWQRSPKRAWQTADLHFPLLLTGTLISPSEPSTFRICCTKAYVPHRAYLSSLTTGTYGP